MSKALTQQNLCVSQNIPPSKQLRWAGVELIYTKGMQPAMLCWFGAEYDGMPLANKQAGKTNHLQHTAY